MFLESEHPFSPILKDKVSFFQWDIHLHEKSTLRDEKASYGSFFGLFCVNFAEFWTIFESHQNFDHFDCFAKNFIFFFMFYPSGLCWLVILVQQITKNMFNLLIRSTILKHKKVRCTSPTCFIKSKIWHVLHKKSKFYILKWVI